MHKPSKVILIAGAVAGIVLMGVVFGLLGTRQPANQRSSLGVLPSAIVPPSPPATFGAAPTAPAVLPVPNQVTGFGAPPPATVLTETNQPANWEERVGEVVGSGDENTNKVRRLLELFSELPEAGKLEVVQHLSNLVADQDYAPLGQLLVDARSPEPVLDVLLADALNRPNSLKLPLLLSVAQNPEHPKAGQSKDILGLYLDGDFGTDWTAWQQKLQQWLKDNPD